MENKKLENLEKIEVKKDFESFIEESVAEKKVDSKEEEEGEVVEESGKHTPGSTSPAPPIDTSIDMAESVLNQTENLDNSISMDTSVNDLIQDLAVTVASLTGLTSVIENLDDSSSKIETVENEALNKVEQNSSTLPKSFYDIGKDIEDEEKIENEIEEEEKKVEEKKVSDAEETKKEVDKESKNYDSDNLEKDYEIPNFNNENKKSDDETPVIKPAETLTTSSNTENIDAKIEKKEEEKETIVKSGDEKQEEPIEISESLYESKIEIINNDEKPVEISQSLIESKIEIINNDDEKSAEIAESLIESKIEVISSPEVEKDTKSPQLETELNSDDIKQIQDSLDEIKNEVESETRSNESEQKVTEVKQTQVKVAEEVKPEKKKKERRLEDEVYEKIIGSDSLLKKITEYGEETEDGGDKRPRNGQICTVSYQAFLKGSETLVESNEDFSFVLGDGDVVPALDLSIALMSKNEKCEIVSESRHAYGVIGKTPDIPPNASLTYKVHLKSFQDIADFNVMNPIERLSLAEFKKLRGNFHFNRQDFYFAINSYKKGLRYFDEDNLKENEEKIDVEKFVELRLALLMNLALSYFKLSDFRTSLETLNEVLMSQSKHMKALYIKGKVLVQMSEFKEAIECLSKASQLDPNNNEIKKELVKAQTKYKTQYDNEKKMYAKMLSGASETKTDANNVKSESLKKKEAADSSFSTYLMAGLAIAAASIGIAIFAKYKNAL